MLVLASDVSKINLEMKNFYFKNNYGRQGSILFPDDFSISTGKNYSFTNFTFESINYTFINEYFKNDSIVLHPSR